MNRMYQDQVMMKSHLFFQVAMIGFRDFDCRFSLGGSMYVDLDWFDGFDLLIDCFIGCLGWIQILIFPWLDSNHWVIHKTCRLRHVVCDLQPVTHVHQKAVPWNLNIIILQKLQYNCPFPRVRSIVCPCEPTAPRNSQTYIYICVCLCTYICIYIYI